MKARPARSVSDGQGLHAAVEAGDLAGRQIGMDNALGGSAVDLGLGSLESGEGGCVITSGDRFLDLANERAHAATTRLVDRGAGSNLAGRLLG